MIYLIAALSQNHKIGLNGKMPWHLPEDLSYFKNITNGYPIVMGRKTFESIGKPLPNRTNIVLTTNPHFSAPGVIVFHHIDDILRLYETNEDPVFVIGGGEIYKAFLPYATSLYLTLIHETVEGDTSFPSYENDFYLTQSTPSQSITASGHPFFFTIWKRKKVTTSFH